MERSKFQFPEKIFQYLTVEKNNKVLLPGNSSAGILDFFRNKGGLDYHLYDNFEITSPNDENLSHCKEGGDWEGRELYLSTIKYDIVISSCDRLDYEEAKRENFIIKQILPKITNGGYLLIELKDDMVFRTDIQKNIGKFFHLERVIYDCDFITKDKPATAWLLCCKISEKIVDSSIAKCIFSTYYSPSTCFELANSDVSFEMNPYSDERGRKILDIDIPLFPFQYLRGVGEKICNGEGLKKFGDYFEKVRDMDVQDFKRLPYGFLVKEDYFDNDPKEIETNAYRHCSEYLVDIDIPKEEYNDSRTKEDNKYNYLENNYACLEKGCYIFIHRKSLKVAVFVSEYVLYIPYKEEKTIDLMSDCIIFKSKGKLYRDELVKWACIIIECLNELKFNPNKFDISQIIPCIMYPENLFSKLEYKNKLQYFKQNIEDYKDTNVKKILSVLEEKSLITKEYDHYIWSSEEKLCNYIQKLSKKENIKEIDKLTGCLCKGLIYLLLNVEIKGKSKRGNIKVIEKVIPCNKIIDDVVREIKHEKKFDFTDKGRNKSLKIIKTITDRLINDK